jgi:hypothetical protein
MKHSLIFLLCALIVSCGASSDSSSSSSSANSSFSQSDLSGTWVGKLTPDNPNDKFRLLYFEATANGEVAEAADSVGNEWYNINATISADLLSNGELIMDFSSDSGPKKLHMEGNMTNSMSSIQGSYNYENLFGVSAVGTFELVLSGGVDQFTNIDFSGSWSGGFGIGHLHNERLLTFELDEAGHVVSGSLINTVTGDEIHHYSAGSGNFEIEDTINGRINNFVLVADDGAIAECGFLLVDIDLELIAGVGTDSEVGAAVIEVRR